MAKVGRKHKYATHVEPRLKDIEWWCREGLTEVEMCKRLGIGITNWERYKGEFGKLRDALKNGKAVADYRIEDSLFKRAEGFEYTEVTAKAVNDALNPGKTKTIPIKMVTKYVAPDPTSMIFWLKNRKRDKWRDNFDHDMSAVMIVYNGGDIDKSDDTGLGENGVSRN